MGKKTKTEAGKAEEPNLPEQPERMQPPEDHAEKQEAAAVAVVPSDEKQDGPKGIKKYTAAFKAHKKWTVPLAILILLAILFAVPYSRYKVLGLFLKKNETVTVTDSTANTPVSDALVSYGSLTVKTSAHGKATLKVPVGYDEVTVSKQYYQSGTKKVLVSLSASNDTMQVKLVATGRQVPVTVINKVSGAPIENAEIKVLNTETKTDKSGKAIIVLPVKASTQDATVTANGFNNLSTKVTVTYQSVPSNTFSLTPSGQLYFLSNLSGNIDVVKTNLDGSGRKTVLAGTGFETPSATVLLASRDWKYLVLSAIRTKNGNPELDLINTSTDKMTNIDRSTADTYISLVGWDGDDFIYRADTNGGQNANQAIKSYDAQTNDLKTIYEITGTGSGSEWAYIGDVYIINGKVVYTTNYSGGTDILQQLAKTPTLNDVNPDGSGSQLIKDFAPPPGQANTSFNVETISYDEPNDIAIQYQYGSGSEEFYEYQNGQVSLSSDLTDQSFYGNNNYPTFLLSPSGNQTFWAEPADGKNNLFIGDTSGNHKKTVATLSDYSPYGWFTDNYLLVSKNSSELYIMPVGGGNPLPVTDYFKPSQFYNNGYGGGYGGL